MGKFRIFLADDDHDDCFLFEEALGELRVSTQLTIVHDGEQLMQLLAASRVEFPDVLFLDLNMPRKNGFVCLDEIKNNERLKCLPVIILSTSFEQEVVNMLYRKGARFYIRKPGSFSQLKKVIHQSLRMLEQDGSSQPPKEKFFYTEDLIKVVRG